VNESAPLFLTSSPFFWLLVPFLCPYFSRHEIFDNFVTSAPSCPRLSPVAFFSRDLHFPLPFFFFLAFQTSSSAFHPPPPGGVGDVLMLVSGLSFSGSDRCICQAPVHPRRFPPLFRSFFFFQNSGPSDLLPFPFCPFLVGLLPLSRAEPATILLVIKFFPTLFFIFFHFMRWSPPRVSRCPVAVSFLLASGGAEAAFFACRLDCPFLAVSLFKSFLFTKEENPTLASRQHRCLPPFSSLAGISAFSKACFLLMLFSDVALIFSFAIG